jgi:phosphoglycolate phosphatase-like HAD superfamily hydrolase
MVKLVLFDIDGTLVHTGGAGVKAFAKAFATEFGITDGTEKLKFAGRTDVSLVREFFSHQQIDPTDDNFKRFFAAYLGWLRQILPESTGDVCHGVGEFLLALETLSDPPVIGLLTGNILEGAKLKLGHFNLWQRFAFGGFADDHEDRDLIAAAAHRRGNEYLKRNLRGEEIVVIGDTHHDIRCARAIGAKVIAVATGSFSVTQLSEFKPDWAVENLTQLSAKDVCGR